MENQLLAGDRVGIMDEADYRHWSRFGSVIGGPNDLVQPNGTVTMYTVQEDGRAGAVPMPANKLVKLGAPGESGQPGEWSAQCFPIDGERPGPAMYFRNGADALAFVRDFINAGLSDEKLHIHAPASATPEQRVQLKNAGVEIV
jgi:hypothetical protein